MFESSFDRASLVFNLTLQLPYGTVRVSGRATFADLPQGGVASRALQTNDRHMCVKKSLTNSSYHGRDQDKAGWNEGGGLCVGRG